MLFTISNQQKWECRISVLLGLFFLYNGNCFEYKVCDNIGSFVQFENKPFNFCVDECSRRQRSKIFMFRTNMNYCALKEEINITSLQDGEPRCSYYTREEWLLDDLGPCRGQPCNVTERCNSKTETEYECVKSECTAPEQIQNARSLSNMYSIGSTNRYKCSNGFKGRGNPSIKCLENATWSMTNFECVIEHSVVELPGMLCPSPKLSYFNADLTEAIEKRNGEILLTYSCRDGFTKTGNEVTIKCDETGTWNAQYITCCPTNSEYSSRGQCRTAVNGGVVTSRNEAKQYCTELGGQTTWVLEDEHIYFDQLKTQYLLQRMQITNVNSMYIKCAAESGVDVIDQEKTIKERVDDVVSNNWTGSGCVFFYTWADGEPSCGEHEDCVFRDINNGNRHFDSECTFGSNVGFVCSLDIPSFP